MPSSGLSPPAEQRWGHESEFSILDVEVIALALDTHRCKTCGTFSGRDYAPAQSVFEKSRGRKNPTREKRAPQPLKKLQTRVDDPDDFGASSASQSAAETREISVDERLRRSYASVRSVESPRVSPESFELPFAECWAPLLSLETYDLISLL